MSYNSFTKNKKTLEKLYGRKVFKKHVFHINNGEGLHWDNHDVYYYYNDENDHEYSPAFKPNNIQKSTQTPQSINVCKYSSCLNPNRYLIQPVKQFTILLKLLHKLPHLPLKLLHKFQPFPPKQSQ